MSSQADLEGPGQPPETCVEARKQIARFLHASPDAAASRFLRAHFERCSDCEALYRDALAGAARAGRAVREDRVERDRERRHFELKRLSRGAGRSATYGRPWLKLFLATCALFFLFTRLPGIGFGASLRAERAQGQVIAANTGLGLDTRLNLVRGDRCLTGPSSSVVLVSGQSELSLGSSGAVLVEEADTDDGPRVRLQAGAMDLAGPCIVTTEFGVLTVLAGRARVELDASAGGVRIQCREGELSFLGPLGAAKLSEGQSAEFGLSG